jgi:hypothetical protein
VYVVPAWQWPAWHEPFCAHDEQPGQVAPVPHIGPAQLVPSLVLVWLQLPSGLHTSVVQSLPSSQLMQALPAEPQCETVTDAWHTPEPLRQVVQQPPAKQVPTVVPIMQLAPLVHGPPPPPVVPVQAPARPPAELSQR